MWLSGVLNRLIHSGPINFSRYSSNHFPTNRCEYFNLVPSIQYDQELGHIDRKPKKIAFDVPGIDSVQDKLVRYRNLT